MAIRLVSVDTENYLLPADVAATLPTTAEVTAAQETAESAASLAADAVTAAAAAVQSVTAGSGVSIGGTATNPIITATGGGSVAAGLVFPTEDNVGLPDGWTPATTVTNGTQHTTPGAVYEDVLFDGTLSANGYITIQPAADGITYRRCRFLNARIEAYYYSPDFTVAFGTTIEECEFVKTTTNVGAGRQAVSTSMSDGVVSRCLIDGWVEAFNIGDNGGPTTALLIADTFIRLNLTGIAGGVYHGDCVQLNGPTNFGLDIYNCTMILPNFDDVDSANACIFSQNHTSGYVTVDRLLVSGGITPAWFESPSIVPDAATNLFVVAGSYSGDPVFFQSGNPAQFSGRLCSMGSSDGQPVALQAIRLA